MLVSHKVSSNPKQLFWNWMPNHLANSTCLEIFYSIHYIINPPNFWSVLLFWGKEWWGWNKEIEFHAWGKNGGGLGLDFELVLIQGEASFAYAKEFYDFNSVCKTKKLSFWWAERTALKITTNNNVLWVILYVEKCCMVWSTLCHPIRKISCVLKSH